MAAITSVQTATISIADGVATNTATITAVVIANCQVFASARGTEATPGGLFDLIFAAARLTSTTVVTAYMGTTDGTTPTKIVRYYVAEFSSGVASQNGTTAKGGAAGIQNITVSSVTLAQSWLPSANWTNRGATDVSYHRGALYLQSATNIEFSSASSEAIGTIVWNVSQYTGGASQRAEIAAASDWTSTTATITAVTLAETLLRHGEEGNNNFDIDAWAIRGRVTLTTELTFDRQEANWAGDIRWELMDYNEGAVQSATFTQAATVATNNETITSTILNQSIACSSNIGYGGRRTVDDTTDRHETVDWTHSLTTTTNLELQRADTGYAVSGAYFVMQFLAAAVAQIRLRTLLGVGI